MQVPIVAQLPDIAVVLSFEGPDGYSNVGGLATRVTQLSQALADRGIDTTLIFLGDPARPAEEMPEPGLTHRRWGQWISAFHPGGVYDGEWGKVNDFSASVPPFVADAIVAPAAAAGKRVLILAEEWHTAGAAIAIDRLLRLRGLRDYADILWNANNTYGFDAIDWPALRGAAQVTTVSRYMKFELAARGVESLVVPNGISGSVLAGPPGEAIDRAARMVRRRPLFVKVGRFDPDKRWLQAIDAFAAVRARHPEAHLLVRGSKHPHGAEVRARAYAAGLDIEGFDGRARFDGDLDRVFSSAAPIVELETFVPDDVLYALYKTADAVLANSGKEPFGYVGLEVMAAGGVAVCGSTGEDYAEPFVNAIVCDTGDGRELAAYLETLIGDRALATRLRAEGRSTAQRFAWPRVLDVLAQKLAFIRSAG